MSESQAVEQPTEPPPKEELPPIPCPYCNKYLTRWYALKRHYCKCPKLKEIIVDPNNDVPEDIKSAYWKYVNWRKRCIHCPDCDVCGPPAKRVVKDYEESKNGEA